MKKFVLEIMLLSLLTTLTACSFQPRSVVNLPDELPDSYVEATVTTVAAEGVARWWTTFGDQTLNSLMDEMFRQNLAIEQVHARLQQVRATVTSVRSARFPSISADAQAGQSREPGLVSDFTGDNYSFSGAAAYELDLWGKVAARARSAGKGYEAAGEELKTLYLGLAAQLAETYYLAVEQRAQIELIDRTIESFAATLASVEERYRRGLVAAIDVYQARQALGAARAGRHLYAANLAVAEHALAVLLGKYPDRQQAGKVAELPPVPQAFPVGIPSELVGRRPDLRAALRQVEAADADIAAAIADRFPSINLIGSYGYTSRELSAGLLEGDYWSFLGKLTLPVFDAGRRRAEVERSRAVARERVAAYQQAVLNAFREVEDALAQNRETELRIARLEETAAAADATLRLALDRYNFGLTDYLPVLSAQRGQVESQSGLLAARRQLIVSRIGLARALGGTWMPEEIEKRNNLEREKKS